MIQFFFFFFSVVQDPVDMELVHDNNTLISIFRNDEIHCFISSNNINSPYQ